MLYRFLLVNLLLYFFSSCFTQNTVGLLSHLPSEAFDGYNLVFPHGQSNVYLLNNCGEIVHLWEGNQNFNPGNSVYLLENGNLVKCKRARTSTINDPIWAGGGGETVEIRTWENELLDSFTLNNASFRLHHDVAPMPNGNILMIAWENKSYEEAIAAGRDTALIPQDKVWSEVILEWNPELDNIVWKWHAWDHLIQNYDSNQANFGQPGNHPELINLNYDEHAGHPDWLHINAIDYNPVLDQIVLSVPYFNEFWIIDHSTTIEEAASHRGGESGNGGDLLYRWGNPQAYNRGVEADQKLFFQHDVHWVNPNAKLGENDFGKIALFNNRLPNDQSSGNIISTLKEGTYQFENSVFSPSTFERIVLYPRENIRAFSNSLSSAQFLPNGNALLLAGRWGFAYEITPQKEIVWEYIVPLKSGAVVEQGDSLTRNNNLTFRMKRYGLNYPAFEGRDLNSKGYWELNPNEGFCGLVNTKEIENTEVSFLIYPNPVTTQLTIETKKYSHQKLKVYDLLGRQITKFVLDPDRKEIDVSSWQKGIYMIVDEKGFAKKVIVQ